MKDTQIKKRRELRRQARSDWGTIKLFKAYHPEMVDPPWSNDRAEWDHYHNAEYGWMTRLAGTWNAIGSSIPSWFRRDANSHTRARQKAALIRAVQNDALEDFDVPAHRRTVRWDWW